MKKTLLIILAATVMLAMIAMATRWFVRGAITYFNGVAFWQDAVKSKPTNELAREMLARSYEDSGDVMSAESTYRSILHMRPEAGTARMRLGYILYRQGKHTEARQLWEPVLHSRDRNFRISAQMALHDNP